MKLWPFNRKSYTEIAAPDQNQLLKALFQYKISAGIATPIDDTPDAYIKQGYSGNADVYSIISRIIRMSTQARLALYKIENGKWVEVTNHELIKFTRNVNPTMKLRDFIQGHLIYKLSIGNSYWYKPALTSGVNKGKATELWLMPGNAVEILGGPSWMNPIGGYILNTNSTVEFKPEEVYHSKFFNPLFADTSTLYGQSPLKAAARIVAKMNQAETTELKQFENQSPPYILFKDGADILGQSLTSEQTGGIEDQFKNYNKKFKSGLPIVLGDKFGVIKLGVSPVDLGILESSQDGRRVLCSVYGIQSELLNDKASSAYNNVIEVKKDAWDNCIKPNLDDFASDLTSFLINPVPEYINAGLFFAFDYSQVSELQADINTKVTWMKAAHWSPNEIREETGAKPIDNPLMNEPWFGMGETPLSAMGAGTEPLPVKNIGDYK